MSETERVWYQDGFTMFMVVVVGGIAALVGSKMYSDYKRDQKPNVFPNISGGVIKSETGTPVFRLRVYHQFPGILRNGRFSMIADGDSIVAKDGIQEEEYSFEEWPPNRDHAKEFDFPINPHEPNKHIFWTFIFITKNSKLEFIKDQWDGETWKSNRE